MTVTRARGATLGKGAIQLGGPLGASGVAQFWLHPKPGVNGTVNVAGVGVAWDLPWNAGTLGDAGILGDTYAGRGPDPPWVSPPPPPSSVRLVI